jgi:hypothetical protein
MQMDDGNAAPRSGAERAEVGYKRPPREHQFKKGQKPPPRKKKEGAEVRISEILRKVLHEPRRVAINGKVCWVSGAELVIRRAYQEAEKGNSTLRRELASLLLSVEAGASDLGLQVVIDPSAPQEATALRLMPAAADGEDC